MGEIVRGVVSMTQTVPIDWLAVTVFVAWVVAIVFAFSWYRKWGGWTSNAFAGVALLALLVPFVLIWWVARGTPVSEHRSQSAN